MRQARRAGRRSGGWRRLAILGLLVVAPSCSKDLPLATGNDLAAPESHDASMARQYMEPDLAWTCDSEPAPDPVDAGACDQPFLDKWTGSKCDAVRFLLDFHRACELLQVDSRFQCQAHQGAPGFECIWSSRLDHSITANEATMLCALRQRLGDEPVCAIYK